MMTLQEKESRVEKARAFFKAGYNCCQSVAMAYADIMELSETEVAKLTSGFGGGFGRMREVCGCFSGMTMVAGAISPSLDPANQAGRTANYALVQELAESFKKETGSIVCRELLGLEKSVKESAQPSERTAEYYKKRPCAELVAMAAGILADKLMESGK